MMSSAATPTVHVIVRLPYNRSEFPLDDPPIVESIHYHLYKRTQYLQVEWNADKENMLWEVIARSRAANSGGTDCKLKKNHKTTVN